MKKYNKSEILKRAWQIFKSQSVKTDAQFSLSLKKSWNIAKGLEVQPVAKAIDLTKIRKDILLFVNWKLGNRFDDAEDITQNALIKVYTALNSYDESKGNFRNWYITIANNCVLDFYRANKDRNSDISVSDFINENGNEKIQIADNNSASSKVENSELAERIEIALNNLKPEYKKVAILRFVEEKEYKEISEICNMAMSNVMSAIHRARKILQRELATA